ncbi:hypothetical protein GXM_07668 [Nostoc sphaeroides CCNUC1]|uniref:Uncharacterized protein n=1 Tax=Nostoc sphaeroides CCNUC1 TaxID=2653204 RepID=A0A5P8WC29_9NOSO|nr:hypothetical protein GXM_07668 [Nostoc sphaeroides CCNUC1]
MLLQVTKLYSYLAEWVEGFREAVIPADVIARAILCDRATRRGGCE